jgi:8-oxo-dGTP pyrophosphatase MutT (NUDIX family)
MTQEVDQRLGQIISSLHRVTVRALIVRDGKLLITKEVSGRPELELRGVPGGGVDRGEDFRTALIRELDEELGVEVSDNQIAAEPIKFDFCDMISADFLRIIPSIQVYFPVRLRADQMPSARDNDFVWLDTDGLKAANFVHHAEPARSLLINYLVQELAK